MNRIENFSGAHAFLSNFYESIIVLDGETYNTVEHAFQAAKTDIASERRLVRACRKPAEAKRLGRKLTLRPDWEEKKVAVMRELPVFKFSNADMRRALLNTGDAELIHTVWWNDTFWGVRNGAGRNMLGKLLMAVREELRGA